MPSNPRLNDTPESKENIVQEEIKRGKSTTVLSQANLRRIKSALQNQTNGIDSAEKQGGAEDLVKTAKNVDSLTQTAPKSNHVLRKNSVALSLPGIQTNYAHSNKIDDSIKQDSAVTEVAVHIKQDSIANDEVLVTSEKPKQPVNPNAPHGICLKCGHFTEPERCKECGQSILPVPERCTGCGQIIPVTCSSCGQVVPSLDWEWHDSRYGYYDKWSYDNAFCRASTSRKLSQSSGDYDSESESHCSCKSEYATNVNEKPCVIADSATRLRKSKWTNFKSYCLRVGRKARTKVVHNKYWSKVWHRDDSGAV